MIAPSWLKAQLRIEHHIVNNSCYYGNSSTTLSPTIIQTPAETLMSNIRQTTTRTSSITSSTNTTTSTATGHGDYPPLLTQIQRQHQQLQQQQKQQHEQPKQKILLFSSNRNGAVGKIIYQLKQVTMTTCFNENNNELNSGAHSSNAIDYSCSNSRSNRSPFPQKDDSYNHVDEGGEIRLTSLMQKENRSKINGESNQHFQLPLIQNLLKDPCNMKKNGSVDENSVDQERSTVLGMKNRRKSQNKMCMIITMYIHSLEIHSDYRGHDLGHFLWMIAMETICCQHEQQQQRNQELVNLKEYDSNHDRQREFKPKRKIRKIAKQLHQQNHDDNENELIQTNKFNTNIVDDDDDNDSCDYDDNDDDVDSERYCDYQSNSAVDNYISQCSPNKLNESYDDDNDSYCIVCQFHVEEDMIRYNRLISYYQRLGCNNITNEDPTNVNKSSSISYHHNPNDSTMVYRSIPMELIQKRYYQYYHVINQLDELMSSIVRRSVSTPLQHDQHHALPNFKKRNTCSSTKSYVTPVVNTKSSTISTWNDNCSFIPIEFVNSNGIDIILFTSHFYCNDDLSLFHENNDHRHCHSMISEKRVSLSKSGNNHHVTSMKKEKQNHMPFGRWLLMIRKENSGNNVDCVDSQPSSISSQRKLMKEYKYSLESTHPHSTCCSCCCYCPSSFLVELRTTKGYGLYITSSSDDARCILLPRDPSLIRRRFRRKGRISTVTLAAAESEKNSLDTSLSSIRTPAEFNNDICGFLFRFIPLFHHLRKDYKCLPQQHSEEEPKRDSSKQYCSRCVCSCDELRQSHDDQPDAVTYGVLQSLVMDDAYLSLDCTNNILLHCSKYPASSLWTIQSNYSRPDPNQSNTKCYPGSSRSVSQTQKVAFMKTSITLQHVGRMKDIPLRLYQDDSVKTRISSIPSHFTPTKLQSQTMPQTQDEFTPQTPVKPILKVSIIEALLHQCHQIPAFPNDQFHHVLTTQCRHHYCSQNTTEISNDTHEYNTPSKFMSLCSYCFYVAEYCRWNGHPDWVQIIGLVYHLGHMFTNDRHSHTDDYANHSHQQENSRPDYMLHVLQSNQARLPDEAWKLLLAASSCMKDNDSNDIRLAHDDSTQSFEKDFVTLLHIVEDQVKSSSLSSPSSTKNYHLRVQLPTLTDCKELWETYYIDIATKYQMAGTINW